MVISFLEENEFKIKKEKEKEKRKILIFNEISVSEKKYIGLHGKDKKSNLFDEFP